MQDIWIAGIARGHNAGICLLKNGEIVFSIEEERLSRTKYDGGPFASMIKVLEYTDRLDYLVIAHTQTLRDTAGRVDFTGDDVYTGLARKLGLIDQTADPRNHPQVIDLSHMHHKLHAACAFYRSGFETATAVIVDGAGTFIPLNAGNENIIGWETETIFSCKYPNDFDTMYKHIGVKGPTPAVILETQEENNSYPAVITDRAGIVKVYEAVTQYCGFSAIEAGKTMGLFPYGKENSNIPDLFETQGKVTASNRNLIIPTYPNAAIVNHLFYNELENSNAEDLSQLENRRDLAFACQTQTQKQVLDLIKKSVQDSGNNNVVLSGGYGLNCVANYSYLDELKDSEINLYVEPVSNDAGTAIGAALIVSQSFSEIGKLQSPASTLYLGPEPVYSQFENLVYDYNAELQHADYSTVIDLLENKEIVAMFQGRSENGPRALGNRSLLFDPRFKDGKDFVNNIKKREYFRPFAGTILQEYADDWFDMKGLQESPYMMYAVNAKPDVEEIIPSVIHVDNTCRIQTLTAEQNYHFYNLIKEFYNRTKIPILFNTSFNLGGEPLVETIEDAFSTVAQSGINYLYFPELEKVVCLKNI